MRLIGSGVRRDVAGSLSLQRRLEFKLISDAVSQTSGDIIRPFRSFHHLKPRAAPPGSDGAAVNNLRLLYYALKMSFLLFPSLDETQSTSRELWMINFRKRGFSYNLFLQYWLLRNKENAYIVCKIHIFGN